MANAWVVHEPDRTRAGQSDGADVLAGALRVLAGAPRRGRCRHDVHSRAPASRGALTTCATPQRAIRRYAASAIARECSSPRPYHSAPRSSRRRRWSNRMPST